VKELEAGIHLILVPKTPHLLSKSIADTAIRTIEHTLAQRRASYHACNVQPDHMHVLLSAGEIPGIEHVIDSLVADLRYAIASSQESMTGFTWDPGVHVTLLPPWHIQIMASFVRDQDRYHRERTFEQELDEVFRPNGIVVEEEPDQEASVLCVN
jgi:hypothetical protein